MKQTKHPNFILGIVSLLLLLMGVFMRMNGYRGGDYILIGSIALGGIHWIWSIIDVLRHQNNASQSRVLWAILVIIVPPVGGLLYYSMSKTVRM
jgi:4-hydroxybenzoate polyprenyltransferase